MFEQNLALSSRRIRLSVWVTLSQLITGLDIDLPALLQGTEEVVGSSVERHNCVPRCGRFTASYRRPNLVRWISCQPK